MNSIHRAKVEERLAIPEKTWLSHCEDMKPEEKTEITVEAVILFDYHFHRTTPCNGWNFMVDEYAIVDSKATVCGEVEEGTIELTEDRPGEG